MLSGGEQFSMLLLLFVLILLNVKINWQIAESNGENIKKMVFGLKNVQN